MLAVVPSFYEELLNRCLVAAEQPGIAALIVLNKIDLARRARSAVERLELYTALGYRVVPLSAKHDVSPLRPLLAGTRQRAGRPVGHGQVHDHQRADSRNGRRDRRKSRPPWIPGATRRRMPALSPRRGIQPHRFAGHAGIRAAPPDGAGHRGGTSRNSVRCSGTCRFHNCRHLVEPGCAIIQAVEEGKVDARRLEAYRKLVKEIESGKAY